MDKVVLTKTKNINNFNLSPLKNYSIKFILISIIKKNAKCWSTQKITLQISILIQSNYYYKGIKKTFWDEAFMVKV